MNIEIIFIRNVVTLLGTYINYGTEKVIEIDRGRRNATKKEKKEEKMSGKGDKRTDRRKGTKNTHDRV